jgi:hypothetical protein
LEESVRVTYWQSKYDTLYTSSDFINPVCVSGPLMPYSEQCSSSLVNTLRETFAVKVWNAIQSFRIFDTHCQSLLSESRTIAWKPVPQAVVHVRLSPDRHHTSVITCACVASVPHLKECVWPIQYIKECRNHSVVIMVSYYDKNKSCKQTYAHACVQSAKGNIAI